jgi:DNA processing protein
MNTWKQIDENERAARRVAWLAVSGDVNRWTSALEAAQRSLWEHWNAPALPELLTELAPTRDDVLRISNDSIAIDPSNERYPDRLLGDVDTPGLLWVDGTIPSGRVIAVVGTRSVDFEGIRLGREIVAELARAGVAIASGGARGVDTVAHRAALDAGAQTIAFLPSGFEQMTPRSNLDLFEEIKEQGALVTEYPADVTPRRYHFHRRNHLIAAFADAVLVVRSKRRGGTMITARAARSIGRPLFVVPGSPEDDTSAGCLALIRDGAGMVRTGSDLLEDMGWDGQPSQPRQTMMAVSDQARAVLDAIDDVAAPDQIARLLDRPVARVHVALLELEMAGLVDRRPGSVFYRRASR